MKIGNIEVYGIIYKITNMINGKCYIGQTVNGFDKRYKAKGTGIEKVYKYNKRMKDSGRRYCNRLYNAIEKYGFDCWEIIEVYDIAFSKKELDIKEKHYIKVLNSSNRERGYNITEGGEGFINYNAWDNKTEEEKEEWRNNISKTRIKNGSSKGENNPMYKRNSWENMTEEERKERSKKQSEKISGINNYFYGKNPSDYMTEETLKERNKKILDANKGLKNKKAKKYKVVDLEGNEIILCGKELYNDHSKGLLNVEKRIFDKYIKPYGNIDIDRINVTSKSKITIEKLRQFNGWIVEEVV